LRVLVDLDLVHSIPHVMSRFGLHGNGNAGPWK